LTPEVSRNSELSSISRVRLRTRPAGFNGSGNDFCAGIREGKSAKRDSSKKPDIAAGRMFHIVPLPIGSPSDEFQKVLGTLIK
jgi:hypothetical protein